MCGLRRIEKIVGKVVSYFTHACRWGVGVQVARIRSASYPAMVVSRANQVIENCTDLLKAVSS